jgi:dihydrofolate reductase
MRRGVLGLGTSLDGYVASPNNDAVDFLFIPKDFSMASFFATINTVVMGRKTIYAALWMGSGSFSGSSMPTYVFSRTQPPGKRNGLIFLNSSPLTFIRQHHKRPGKNIWPWAEASSRGTSSKRTWSMNSTSASFQCCSVKESRSS